MTIQEFSFGNYRSFKDVQTLNLAAANLKSKNKELDKKNIIQSDSAPSFLKSKAIYGANASGKSNIIQAFKTFIKIIKSSVKDERALNYVDSYKLSTETRDEPSFFQIIFWDKGTRYRYGFELDNLSIHSEWLFGKLNERELPFFIREEKEIIKIDKSNFSEGNKLVSLFDEDPTDNDIFRSNSLFLSTLASFGFGKVSKSVLESISSIAVISGLGEKSMIDYAGDAIQDKEKKNYIIDFLKYGDIGLEDVDQIEITPKDLPEDLDEDIKNHFNKSKNRKFLFSARKKYNEKLEFQENEYFPFNIHESEGTQKLFELSPYIYDAITKGLPIIIDEFDARFHPLLTKKILELFNSNENSNSQLIFTTHDTNLLSSDLVRKDQIEFVEKDKYGASHIYSLAEFKGIRNTASFEKDYIQGRYGAIPFLGNFSKLFNTSANAQKN